VTLLRNEENEMSYAVSLMFMVLLGAATVNYILVAICHRQSIAVLRNFHLVIFIVPIYISVFVPNAYGTIGDIELTSLNNP
jgi:ABC-type Na+ efflux pump permease subunit